MRKNTNYASKLCVKIQIMPKNYALCTKSQIMHYRGNTRFFTHSHNRIILEGLIFRRILVICMQYKRSKCKPIDFRYSYRIKNRMKADCFTDISNSFRSDIDLGKETPSTGSPNDQLYNEIYPDPYNTNWFITLELTRSKFPKKM